ncbi:uncharacterized protein LODBEIA_P35080 [Lodderomyces beijingensis]|uniref:Autophagy-related protein 27 n=1 Tax=Lodderomyces beijingensis TaxID=1775926 RepID=A0ABP0ZMB8_9ASCO
MLFKLLVSVSTLVLTSTAIDCSAKELQPYNFESIKGTHSITNIKNTPPSKTSITWSVGFCDAIHDITNCPPNSDLCGITTIFRDNESPVVSEIIAFNSNIQKTYVPIDNGDGGITILYKGANWGDSLVDAELRLACDKNARDDDFKIDEWTGQSLKITLNTKAACITSEKDKKKNNGGTPKKDNGESWGWFTWIFIFLVLFLSIYIIGGAWFQYNKGNAIDFQSALKEVIENFFDLLKSLPGFVREIVEKFTGSSNRGDYSAV